MPNDLWQWKYVLQDKPGMLAHVADTIVAYYGGMPRTFHLNGTAIQAVQICDVMVAPEMRGILTRRGPFMQTADTFLTEKAGQNKPYRFAFGFPSDRHARLGEKSGWYKRSDTFLEAHWTTRNHQSSLPFLYKTRPITTPVIEKINSVWKTMQSALPNCLVPQKDTDFFNWRYLNHPCHAYSVYSVANRWSNDIVGIFVLRDHSASQSMELIDLLCMPDKMDILLKTALTIAKRCNREQLFSWLTPAVLKYLPEPTTIKEVSGVYVTPDYKQIIDNKKLSWWLIGGDTDHR